jgi:hypothetical protein
MQAGLANHVWSMEEIVNLIDEVDVPQPATSIEIYSFSP